MDCELTEDRLTPRGSNPMRSNWPLRIVDMAAPRDTWLVPEPPAYVISTLSVCQLYVVPQNHTWPTRVQKYGTLPSERRRQRDYSPS
jgi:hypothetical protein